MRCPRCGYEWEPRVPNPRECPRCKGRLDYPSRAAGAPIIMKTQKEVSKGMSGRLPWVAAAVIIVIVAALGAWALSTPSTPATATVRALFSGPSVQQEGRWLAIAGPTSGADNCAIENIYIVDNGSSASDKLGDSDTANENLADHFLGFVAENYLLNGASDPIIDNNNDNATIPYEVPFEIVVAAVIVADADYVGDKAQVRLAAYVNPENVYVRLSWSGNLVNPPGTGDNENTQITGFEYAFDNDCPWTSGASNSGYDGRIGTGYKDLPGGPINLWNMRDNVDYARVNFVFTRGGNGFTLPAGGTLNLNQVVLWVWA